MSVYHTVLPGSKIVGNQVDAAGEAKRAQCGVQLAAIVSSTGLNGSPFQPPHVADFRPS